MIAALLEGIVQSVLPCSWMLLLPAVGIGVALPRFRVLTAMALASVGVAWMAVSGWLVLPLPISGVLLVAASAMWWFKGLDVWSAALIGSGAASAWQPCVGPELGTVLTQAQTDPVAALPGLAAFLLGILLVGFAIGWVGARLINDRVMKITVRVATIAVGVIGVSMIIGLYPAISSTLASWSYYLWA